MQPIESVPPMTEASTSSNTPVFSQSVFVRKLRVRDFGPIVDLEIDLEPHVTILLGDNNVGKSSVLKAMQVALGSVRPASEDFRREEANGSTISFPNFVLDLWCEFLDAPVRTPGDGSAPEGIEALEERIEAFQNRIGADNLEDNRFFIRTLGTSASMSSGGEPSVERFFMSEWSGGMPARNSTVNEYKVQKKNDVGTRVSSVFDCFSLGEQRDLSVELTQQRSNWGRIVADPSISGSDRSELSAKSNELSKKVLESSANLIAANEGIASLATSFGSSVRSAKLEAVTSDPTQLARQVDIHVQDSVGPHLPIRLQGAGIRSAAAILSFDVRMKLEQRAKSLPPEPVLLIEEPEAHLHPIAQRSVAKIIGEFMGQVVVATHSSGIALELASRGPKPLSQIRSLVCSSKGRAVGQLTDLRLLDGASTVSFRLIEQNEGTALFSKAVILVEGITDLTVLPIFADCFFREKNWLLNRGISVNRTDSVDSIKNVALALQDLKIPFVALYDYDKGQNALEGVLNKYACTPDLEGEFASDLLRAASIDRAISKIFPDSALQTFIRDTTKNPGSKYSPEEVQGRKHSDWIAHFLRRKVKNEQAGNIAQYVCNDASVLFESKVPAGVRSVLEYVESVVKGT